MVDLVEEVGISHGSAANHDCVSTDFFDTLFGFLNSTDVTVSDKWNLGQSLSDLVKGLKVCVTCIHLLTGAAMHGEGRNTCSFSSAVSYTHLDVYKRQGEDAAHACQREVREEVNLDLPLEKIEQLMTVSTPGRDPRGWTVTIAHLVYLPSRALDLVQAGDDAKDVVFVDVDFQTGKCLSLIHIWQTMSLPMSK